MQGHACVPDVCRAAGYGRSAITKLSERDCSEQVAGRNQQTTQRGRAIWPPCMARPQVSSSSSTRTKRSASAAAGAGSTPKRGDAARARGSSLGAQAGSPGGVALHHGGSVEAAAQGVPGPGPSTTATLPAPAVQGPELGGLQGQGHSPGAILGVVPGAEGPGSGGSRTPGGRRRRGSAGAHVSSPAGPSAQQPSPEGIQGHGHSNQGVPAHHASAEPFSPGAHAQPEAMQGVHASGSMAGQAGLELGSSGGLAGG